MEKVRLVNDVFSIAESKNFLKEEWDVLDDLEERQ
ncbi:hypothetical protein [Enterococcus phage vB_Efs6_KEN16]|uniref:Uncharacterized protein n=1 Tax=Enterococcus phage vB_Efs6_KEN16 TaxID=3138325 RepID=A0AAX4PU65_9CAUD